LQVAPLACQLDELGAGVRVATIGKTAQLVQVTSLGGEFDELPDRVLVTVRSPLPQIGQGISHAARVRGGRSAGSEQHWLLARWENVKQGTPVTPALLRGDLTIHSQRPGTRSGRRANDVPSRTRSAPGG
jgi:hypothetical protein